jgi:hypothetical protein
MITSFSIVAIQEVTITELPIRVWTQNHEEQWILGNIVNIHL